VAFKAKSGFRETPDWQGSSLGQGPIFETKRGCTQTLSSQRIPG
jgi:hypothetical protein